MPRWKEYEACVEVDGKPLPEYKEVFGIAANGTPCVLVWIPSESGKVGLRLSPHISPLIL
jgi:hypothetical protein